MTSFDPFMVRGEQEPYALPLYNQPHTAEQRGGGWVGELGKRT